MKTKKMPMKFMSELKDKLTTSNDILAIEYLDLLDNKGKHFLRDAEIPCTYLPSRVQIILRPYLKPLGYRFGYRNKNGEKVWGFYKLYERKAA
ncbi:hypothetical protein SM738_003910 [Vibrio vulnificus]|nr:hypothetical protein [Vibrio vulnificus]